MVGGKWVQGAEVRVFSFFSSSWRGCSGGWVRWCSWEGGYWEEGEEGPAREREGKGEGRGGEDRGGGEEGERESDYGLHPDGYWGRGGWACVLITPRILVCG